MKISCTVKEFGQLVRGCEKNSCYNCPLTQVGCGKGGRIEQFIDAENVVDESQPNAKRWRDIRNKILAENYGGYQPTEAPERLILPVGGGGEDG